MGNLNYCEQKEDEKTQIRSNNQCELINIGDNDFIICDYSKSPYDPFTFSRNSKKGKKRETKFNTLTEKRSNKNKYNLNNKPKIYNNKPLLKGKKSLTHSSSELMTRMNFLNKNPVKFSNSCKALCNENQIFPNIRLNNTFTNNIQKRESKINNNNKNNNLINKEKIKRNESAIKIQRKFRCFKNKKYYQDFLRPKLIREQEFYINHLLKECRKNIKFESQEKYSLTGYQKFYPKNDPFFKYNYGKVFSNQVRIEKISPEEFSVYQGEMNINNEKHGFGKLTTPKSELIGTWRNNKFTGWNRESNFKGNYIEGKFINGVVNGKGILGNRKNKYVGDFKNSIRNGIGELITKKFYYKGEFVNNNIEGYGKMKFLLEGHEYSGHFKENQIEGWGVFKWKNGDIYEGEMKNGKIHGKGKYYYSNGEIFEGNFINGIRQQP